MKKCSFSEEKNFDLKYSVIIIIEYFDGSVFAGNPK